MGAHYHIAIIGGGIAGCALLYQLSKSGCDNIVLLEKGELTSGSTWHAAGNIPLYMGGHTLTGLHKASLHFYETFAKQTKKNIGLHRCGSLKLATDATEARAQKDYRAIAKSVGINFEVINPDEVLRRFPYVSVNDVLSAALTPDDGHVDPASLTMALAAASRKNGATVLRHKPVLAIERYQNGYWRLISNDDSITAKHVVNAAGLHSREIAEMFGHKIPVVPMERQYLITEPLPELAQLPHELPVLRDAAAPLYIRQEGSAMLLGLYDSKPVFWAIEGTPPDFDQELLPANLERVGDALRNAMRRLPVLQTLGIKKVVNGPLLRTPDACPLIGPVAGLSNVWLNTGYFAGIAQAGGAAAILCRWLLTGDPGDDVSAIVADRFGNNVSTTDTMRITCEAYEQELGQVIDGTRVAPIKSHGG